MVDKLKQLREPVAWIALGALALHLLWMLVTFVWYAANDGRFALGNAGWVIVTQQSGVIVLATAVAVLACALWQQPSENARLLALLATVGFAAVAGLGAIFALIGGVAGAAWLVVLRAGLLEAVVPLLAGLVTFQVLRGLPAPVSSRPQPDFGMPGPSQHQTTQQPPQQPPQWGPTQPVHPPPGQTWGPPPGQPGDARNEQLNPGSQFDQFGNRPPNSADNFQPFSKMPQQGEWQPAAQPPPQRLEPSPDQPPVGPHTSQPAPPDSAWGTGDPSGPNHPHQPNHEEDPGRSYPTGPGPNHPTEDDHRR